MLTPTTDTLGGNSETEAGPKSEPGQCPARSGERAHFTLRPIREDDLAFVFDAWTRSAHERYPERLIPPRVFAEYLRPQIQALLEAEDTRVVVAADPLDPGTIYGFAIAGPAALHYCYVKHKFRGFGVARAMVLELFPRFGKDPLTITWLPSRTPTRSVEQTLRQWQLTYNPYEGRRA